MADTPFPPSAPVPDAGWYPDPAGSGGMRWWDGKGWTDHVRPDATAPASPAGATSSGPTGPTTPAGPGGTGASSELPWWATAGGGTPPSWWQDAEPSTGATGGPMWTQPNAPGPANGTPIAPYARPRSIVLPRADGAVRALVLGLLSVLCCGILGPFAIYAGVNARFRIRVSNGRLGGDGMAIAGIFFGVVGTIFWLWGMYLALTGRPILPTTTTGR